VDAPPVPELELPVDAPPVPELELPVVDPPPLPELELEVVEPPPLPPVPVDIEPPPDPHAAIERPGTSMAMSTAGARRLRRRARPSRS
jgi:hypothetical protein